MNLSGSVQAHRVSRIPGGTLMNVKERINVSGNKGEIER
jgi:hypothetical protein